MVVRQVVQVLRTPDAVYRFLVDQDSWAAMDPTLLSIDPRGEVEEGMTGTMRRRVNGLRVTNGWTVTELKAPTRLAMRITGAGYALTETMTLAANDGGTEVTIVDELEPTSTVGRLFVAMSGRFVRRDLAARAGRLTSLLESGDAA